MTIAQNDRHAQRRIGIHIHGQARKSGKRPLGLTELVAIAVGGMIGGGIFSVLGVGAEYAGYATIYALLIGGVLAILSVYSYGKLARYYRDDGATYSFFKRTYPYSHTAPSIIGWIVIFGYISTLALYANTFGSYFVSALGFPAGWPAKIAATGLLILFTVVNLLSVRGMGVIEDVLVYAKLVAIVVISVLFVAHAHHPVTADLLHGHHSLFNVLSIATVTFVAYEGFQLTINAFRDASEPTKTVPRAMYVAVFLVTAVYLVLAFGALSALSLQSIVHGKEFALAAGAQQAIGTIGYVAVIMSALFATTSALSGTLYGASRMMSVIAEDGYMPAVLAKRSAKGIPRASIVAMALLAFLLLISGTLQKILEFGSFTFMASSLLMAVACLKIWASTRSSRAVLWASIVGLGGGLVLLTAFQFRQEPGTLIYTFGIYAVIGVCALYYRIQAAKRLPLPHSEPLDRHAN